MTRRLEALIVGSLLAAATACVGMEAGAPEGEDAPDLESQDGDDDDHEHPGEDLFFEESFDGNGRRCGTCHPSEKGTLSPSDVQRRFSENPKGRLFRHDAADTIGGSTFDRVRTHATILVELPLAPNVSIAGSSARTVIVARGIPTTNNTPALDPVLMLDGRAPNLVEQARGAIVGHAQTTDVTTAELESIADFELTLFNRRNMRQLAEYGKQPTMPYGWTDSQRRGRRFFIADDQVDPDLVGELPSQPCGWCHSGDMLNGTSKLFGDVLAPIRLPEGFRFLNVFVSELNRVGNPVHTFEFRLPDGSVQTIQSPDPGLALLSGNPNMKGFFKIPTLWGSASTAPYFHDNSSKTFEQLMDHYQTFFTMSGVPVNLTAQDKADIIAYLKIL